MYTLYIFSNNNNMINGYKIENDDVLYLYLDYSYEFASFNDVEKKVRLLDNVKEYINRMKIKFKGKYIVLVVAGVAIITLACNFGKINEDNNSFSPDPEIIDIIAYKTYPYTSNQLIKDNSYEIVLKSENTINKEKLIAEETIQDNQNVAVQAQSETTKVEDVKQATQEVITKAPNTTTQNTTKTPNTTTQSTTKVPNTTTQTQNSNSSSTIQSPINETKVEETTSTEKMVTIYRSNGTILTIELEEYLIGVVAAEMPASFNVEALKAQAVVARTYTLKRLDEGKVLTDTTSTQVYKDNNQLKTLWGNSYSTYYNKVKQAVNETKGIYLTYNNKYIDAVYHSTSNGYTEDAVAVWGNNIPYLKSVDSLWDKSASSYLKSTTIDINELNTILKITLDTEIILTKDNNNRVTNVTIGNNSYTGVQFRNLLGLRSTDFDIEINDNIITITTRGYGHGVGMSQYGANGMANSGYNYKDILNHYYANIQIKS